MDTPQHPTVDWLITRRDAANRLEVAVTCPVCNKQRFCNAGLVRYRVKNGTFNGRCYRDRLFQVERRVTKYGPRKPRPPHPAVDWTDTKVLPVPGPGFKQHHLTRVGIVCPSCKQKRYTHPGQVAAKIREGRFSGLCLPCSPNARKREWVVLSPGRKLDPVKGYIRLGAEAIAPEDMWLYDAMRGTRTFLHEHRLVMAKVLGRPLESYELVDHMDGVKTNNDPANLRLYRRGRNEPGEHSGYGTYYHEWQMAEAEIRRLREELAAFSRGVAG